MYVASGLLSLPYCYNVWTTLQAVRKRKQETGVLRFTPREILALGAADFAFLTCGLGVYMFLVRFVSVCFWSRSNRRIQVLLAG